MRHVYRTFWFAAAAWIFYMAGIIGPLLFPHGAGYMLITMAVFITTAGFCHEYGIEVGSKHRTPKPIHRELSYPEHPDYDVETDPMCADDVEARMYEHDGEAYRRQVENSKILAAAGVPPIRFGTNRIKAPPEGEI